MLPADLPPPPVRVIIPEGEELLEDVVTRACREHMYVVLKGAQVIVCSIVPVGWKKIGLGDRQAHARVSLCR